MIYWSWATCLGSNIACVSTRTAMKIVRTAHSLNHKRMPLKCSEVAFVYLTTFCFYWTPIIRSEEHSNNSAQSAKSMYDYFSQKIGIFSDDHTNRGVIPKICNSNKQIGLHIQLVESLHDTLCWKKYMNNA